MFFTKIRVRFKLGAITTNSIVRLILFTLILIHLIIATDESRKHETETSTPHLNTHRTHQHRRVINHHNKTKVDSVKRTAGLNGEYNLQRDYIATTVGKDIQLDCKMKNLANDDDKIVWLKMPKGEVLTLNGNRVGQDPRVNSKCVQNLIPCWSLVITDTKESDSGFYVCQTNAMHTKYIYLDIMVPPKLLTNYPVDKIDVNQSSNASITCEFYGKPEPLVKWYKYSNGVQKEIERYRGHKTINFLVHKDSPSEFECVADNSIPPTISKKIYLNIQYSPVLKQLNYKVYQKLGERVIFDSYVHSNPNARVFWFKNHSRIHESSKYNFETLENNLHRLYINNLTENDFGDYFLTAANVLGKSSTKFELIRLPSANRHNVHNHQPNLNDELKSSTRSEIFLPTTLLTHTTRLIISQSDNKNKNLRNSFKITLNEKEENIEQIFHSNINNNDENNDVKSYINTSPASYFTKQHKSKLPASKSNKLVHYSNQTSNKNSRKHSKDRPFVSTSTFSISQDDLDSSSIVVGLNVNLFKLTSSTFFILWYLIFK